MAMDGQWMARGITNSDACAVSMLLKQVWMLHKSPIKSAHENTVPPGNISWLKISLICFRGILTVVVGKYVFTINSRLLNNAPTGAMFLSHICFMPLGLHNSPQ